MTLFGSNERCWRYLDMGYEPKLSHARPAQKRQHGGVLIPVYEYQKIPPLISRFPVKIRRGHLGARTKTNLRPLTELRGSKNPATGSIKLRAEELHSIKGELSQIKAQVDSLLESLDRMDQRHEQPTGAKEGKKKALASGEVSGQAGEPSQKKESTDHETHTAVEDYDSADESTDTEEAARNHTLELEGNN